MAHFALLDENNKVIGVYPGRDDVTEQELSDRTGQSYKQTSYNTRHGNHLLGGKPFRMNFAGIGSTYDAVRDAFIPPKPADDFVFDEAICDWVEPNEY
jgi:hypothetical protein